MPEPEKVIEVWFLSPSILTVPVRSILEPPAWVPTRWAAMLALAETRAPARSKTTSTLPVAVLGPTLTVPETLAATPVVSEAEKSMAALVTVMSPTFTDGACAVSFREATP